MKKTDWLMAALMAAAMALPACSKDDTEHIYIVAFDNLELWENAETGVKVRLSQGPSTRRYVTVINAWTKNVGISFQGSMDNDIVIPYDAGKTEKTVDVMGIKETSGKAVPVVFSIRDSNEQQTLRVLVTPYVRPDGGVWPDTGPIEAGAMEAGAKEAGAKEAGAKEASTPDATSSH